MKRGGKEGITLSPVLIQLLRDIRDGKLGTPIHIVGLGKVQKRHINRLLQLNLIYPFHSEATGDLLEYRLTQYCLKTCDQLSNIEWSAQIIALTAGGAEGKVLHTFASYSDRYRGDLANNIRQRCLQFMKDGKPFEIVIIPKAR